MTVKTPGCWEAAHQLYNEGKKDDAIRVCEQEPCASKSALCQRFLGWQYYKKNDLDKALFWFTRAINLGDAESLYGVAGAYFAKKDFINAVKFHKEALSKGFFRSCHWLGLLYENGLGVEKDVDAAIDYYRKGAIHGYMFAEAALSRVLFKTASPATKVFLHAKRMFYSIKLFIIALRNIKDERLADIPENPPGKWQ